MSLISSPFNRWVVLCGVVVCAFLGTTLPVTVDSANETVLPPPPPPPYPNISYDYDGDGKADIGRWHSANTEFKVKKSGSSGYLTFSVGTSNAKAAPGNYDGFGYMDAGTFYNGTWKYKTSETGSETTETWGTSGDIPVPGNYDGNGTTDYAVFRPSDNSWRIKKRPSGNEVTTYFGASGDIPVPGDYDGDGTTDLAHFRPSNGRWYLQRSTAGNTDFAWGLSGDIPIQGDFDDDGKSDAVVYRPSSGAWHIKKSSGGSPDYFQFTWGSYGDQPAAADYDGDGRTDYCVWRPTTGVWYIYPNNPEMEPDPVTETLGVPGDVAIPSAYTKQIAGTATGYDMAGVRLAPRNATGSTNLYSQNFSWGTSLVSLPGRSGMNAGFGIGYNSLVWAKVGSAMYFDPDASNVTPGFRFGFPVIEPVYYDTAKSAWAYMMVTPNGARVEFRQQAAGNTFLTADSSYTRLVTSGNTNPNDPVEDIDITVTTTDGTQMKYEWNTGAYRCIEIKDRNGNFITIAHDSYGKLTTMTDTLGRVVTVNYDSEGYPTSVTQTWRQSNGEGSTTTHTWASFSYTTKTVDTDFHSSITAVFGPPDTTVVKVLEKITYADTSWTKFLYNSYLQVYKVENYADDDHKLNHTWINIESPSSAQQDCPRFTQTKTYTENFNSGNDVVVDNTLTTGSSYSLPDNISGSATKITVQMSNHPTSGFRTKTYVGASGWNEGLPIATEDCLSDGCSGTDRVRWTWNEWEQDTPDGSPYSYMVNPRISETRVGDGTNTKRTELIYLQTGEAGNVAKYGLVSEVRVSDAAAPTTILKKTVTEYNFGQQLVLRRIIGLPSKIEQWGREGSSLNLVSKVTFNYDEEGYGGSGQSVTASKHDGLNYGTSHTFRGNLTRTRRWDVTVPTTESASVSMQNKFNITGSPISQTDARGRVTAISYTDNFNTTVSPATFAYPTTVTDAGLNSSMIKYRYDFGANVEAHSPTPEGANDGKNTSRIYNDTTGRIERETIENHGGAYTRYVYATSGNAMTSYSTIIDTDGGGAGTGDEVATLTEFDGAGRVRRTRTENPNAPSGGYSGKLLQYDLLGRVTGETVPTEINSSWTPVGDDVAGWLWNSKQYDWMGRVKRIIPTDSNTNGDQDTIIEYTGCGCAGGQVTTIKGPKLAEAYGVTGTGLQYDKRPWQKVHEDVLGRTYKTEVWDLDGQNGTIYSSTFTEFNGRDQALTISEYAGPVASSTPQVTTMAYDGHGRLSQKHLPQWSDYINPKYTTTTYNEDDSVATVIDPRGAKTTYTYGLPTTNEKRALVTAIAYDTPSPNPTPDSYLHVPDVPDVTFTYDDAGNRTLMSDGSGTLTYSYDELSRLKTETKTFADYPQDPRTLTYEYHLAGGLSSITDPFNRTTTYSADKLGRTTAIGASGDSIAKGGEEAYASEIQYRAFGAVKEMTMNTEAQTTLTMTYDNALRPLSYLASNTVSNDIQSASYTYGNDGLVKDITNNRDHKFDQINKYDFAGRLKVNNVGATTVGYPFTQTMSYDAFDNLTQRSNNIYGTYQDTFTTSYHNNRKNGSDVYDNAGNVVLTNDPANLSGGQPYNDLKKWNFDAAGRMAKWRQNGPWGIYENSEETTYDGDGRASKRYEVNQTLGILVWHFIYSSVTGQRINEILDGDRVATNVYMGDSMIAQERNDPAVYFNLTDPVTGSTQQVNADGSVPADTSNPDDFYPPHVEMAGMGTNVPLTVPTPSYPLPPRRGGFGGDAEFGCKMYVDGFEVSNFACTMAQLAGTSTLTIGGYRQTGWKVSYKTSHGNVTRHYSMSQTAVMQGALEGGEKITAIYGGFVSGAALFNFGQQQTTPTEPLPSKENLRKALVNRLDLNNGECRKFLEEVMKNLKISGTVEDMYDNFVKKNGFVETGDANGHSDDGKGNIGLPTLQRSTNDPEKYVNQMRFVGVVIHEMWHRKGKGHSKMAQAVEKSLTEEEKKKYQRTKKGDASDSTYTSWWMNEKCRFNPDDANEVKQNVVQ